MNTLNKILVLLFTMFWLPTEAQNIIENYDPAQNDSLRIGTKKEDVLPYIQKGYTLMLPESKPIKGVLIFLEDSGFDQKNKNAKQIYSLGAKNGFAILSVSTEIPFDFYFSESSVHTAHSIIQQAFAKHNLPNTNIFFLGGSLVGHRAMQYIKHTAKNSNTFKLNIEGIVMCHFTLDWTRKWHQHQRDIAINKIDLWEPKFINYMLETYLEGTPKTNPEGYHEFSPYSYFDLEHRNIEIYKNYAIRAYTKPDITYRLKTYYRTMYDNNTTDIVGFLAELELAENSNTELIVLHPEENASFNKSAASTWNTIDKQDLMYWINQQID